MLNNNIKETKSKEVYLFTGIMSCPYCGRQLSATYSKKQINKQGDRVYIYHNKYHTYRCNHSYINKSCTYRKRPNEDKIETMLIAQFDELVHGHIEASKIEDARVRDSHASDKMVSIRGEMDRLTKAFRKNRITEDEYDKEYEYLEEQLKELQSHLEPVLERDLTPYEEILKSDWKGLYNALNRENRRSFWRKYIKAIELNENGTFKRAIFF